MQCISLIMLIFLRLLSSLVIYTVIKTDFLPYLQLRYKLLYSLQKSTYKFQ